MARLTPIKFSRVLSIVLFACLTLLSSCSGEDDFSIFSTIKGHVIDATTSDPLSGVVVTLSPGNQSTLTTDDGSFEFRDLESYQYTITAQKSGYQANRKNITAVSGETTNVYLQLTKIPVE